MDHRGADAGVVHEHSRREGAPRTAQKEGGPCAVDDT